jgi:tetratricopeptide (TPR) repeat protein
MKQFVFFICILFLTINHAQAAGSDSAPEVAKPSSYKKVLSMIKKEQYADAITELEKILTNTNYASDPDILNHYAYSLRKTQNLIKAEEYYKKALSIDPSHRGALEYIGELYVDTKRLDLANATLKKLENCRCEEYAELKSYINK